MLNITATPKLLKRLFRELDNSRGRGDSRLVKQITAIILTVQGEKMSTIAQRVDVNVETVRRWISGFILNRIDSLLRKKSPGRPPKLTKSQKIKLKEIIKNPPCEAGYLSGCWDSKMIQDYIQREFKIYYNRHYICNLLNNLGFSYQKATQISEKRNEDIRDHWKKNFLPWVINKSKNEGSMLLFEDEAFFKQWGSLSYTWSLRGIQPIVKASGNRRSYKVFGAIDYWSGRTFFNCVEEKFNGKTYIAFLEKIIKSTTKKVIIIHDNAGYHRSAEINEFFEVNKKRIKKYQLPPYSPDFNPIEKLWKKVRKIGTHLKHFPTFESLVSCVNQSLEVFSRNRDEVLSLFKSSKTRLKLQEA